MTVTIVCDVLGAENNGTTIAAMNLINSLRKKGHTVRVVCPDEDRRGCEDYYIVPTFDAGPFREYVHKNGVVIAKPDNKIILQAIDGADIVHVMTPFFLCRRAAHLAYERNIPVSGGFHAMAENLSAHLFMMNSNLFNKLTYKYYHGLYKYCSAIHFPTRFLYDLYTGMYGDTNGYVISNGVNGRFMPIDAERPDKYKDKLVILFTGRYSTEKSHKILIDAVMKSKFRDRIQLIFAGDGPKKKKLQKYSEKLPIFPVFNFFSHDEMLQILNYADLYVHPAEVEAEGIACLEAIACGLVPVISNSPRSATKFYAIDDMNLFKYDSPADLAEKIDYWCSHADEKAIRSREYLGYAKEQFNLDSCMDKMEQMLIETVNSANNKEAARQ